MDIQIIGVAQSGVSLAYELSEKGLQIMVVASGNVGDRYSATNKGAVVKAVFRWSQYPCGIKIFEIVAEMGVNPEFRKTGNEL